MANIGFATLSIIPSALGMGSALTKSMAPEMEVAGRSGGALLSSAVAGGLAVGAAGVTAAVGGLVAVGDKFANLSKTIQYTTGASGQALDGLMASVKVVGAKTPASLEAVSESLAKLNQRTGLTGPALEKLTQQTLKVGAIQGVALDINSATGAMAAFGVKGDDMSGALDQVFKASRASGVGMNELLGSVQKGAPQLKQFGYSIGESAGLLGMLDKSGLNSDKVIAGLSKGMVGFAKAGLEPKKALQDTVSEIQNFTKTGRDAEALALAAKLFGTKGAPQFIEAVKSGAFNAEKLNEVMKNSGAGIMDAAGAVPSLTKTMSIFKNQVMIQLEPLATRVFQVFTTGLQWLGSTGMPLLASFGGAVNEKLKPVFTWLGEKVPPIWEQIQSGIKGFALAFQDGSDEVMTTGISGFLEQLGVWTRNVWDVMQGQLFPALKVVAGVLFDVGKAAMPVVIDAFRIVFAAIRDVIGAVSSVVGFFKEHKDVAIALGAVLAVALLPTLISMGATLVLQAAAWTYMTVGMTAYNVITKLAAAGQWLLNAAMSANPIGLVVVILAALVAGLVLAFRHSESFRSIVMAAWQGIQAAASFAWNSILKPTFDAFMVALHWVGDAAMWLWHNAIEPAFAGIKFAIEVVWFAIKVYFDLWKFAIMDVLVPAVMWLWHNVIEPGFNAIGQIISGVWNSVIRPTFDFLKAALGAVGDYFTFVWNAVIKPAWSALGDGVRFVYDSVLVPTWNGLKAALGAVGDFFNWVWNSVIRPAWSALGDGVRGVYESVLRPTWDALKAALGLVGDFFSATWNNVIRPVWDALGAGISAVYENVIRPVWDRMKGALGVVGDFFREVVGGIKSKWDELRDAISTPINVVIGFLDQKLGGAWRAVKSVLPVLPDFPKLAEGGRPGEGGRLSGPGTGTSDSILGMNYFTGLSTAHVSNREFVVNERSTDKYLDEITAINAGTFPKLALGGLPSGTVIGSGTAGVDGGTTWPALFAKVKGQFPWALNNSDVRPGDSGYHSKGQAVDIGAPGNDQGMLDQVGAWAVQNMGGINEIIHNPNASVKNGQNVPASFWGAQTWAEHANHVHLASSGLGLSGSAVGDAGVLGNAALAVTHFLRDKAAGIFDLAMKPVSALVDNLLPSDGPGFNKMPKGVFDTVRDAARSFIVGKADAVDAASSSGSTSLGPLGGNADAYAREIFRSATEHGFGKEGAVIGLATALVESNLRMYANAGVPESLGFPHDAVGSDHDSVGLFQQRQAGWGTLAERMNAHASADLFFNKLGGFDWRSMAPGAAAQRVQVSAFPEAYNGRIGDAQNMVNGFDFGGIASGAGWLPKPTVEPERVLSPQHTIAFDKMVAQNFQPNSAVAQAAKPPVTAGIYVAEGATFTTHDEAETNRLARNEAARLAAAF